MVTSDKKITYRKVKDLSLLKDNPRKISKEDMNRLLDSIKINGFWYHRPLAIMERDKKLIVLAGNQRLKAAKRLKIEEVPTVLYINPTKEEIDEIIIRDNVNNGDWDLPLLNSERWDSSNLEFMGLELPGLSQQETRVETKNEADDELKDFEEKEDFYKSMWKDVLYESNNTFEIPNLLLDKQAGKLELPLSPWGANSRLRKDVSTYHFYVDDYRFEALFKDPIKLLTSGCKSIVEPNCSLHDQTPIALGLQLIYKKRYLSRYMQECGMDVYVDLNVSHKFIEYNKMGIPKGYNAFFTRGLDGWMESLKSDLAVAQEISGVEIPNLVVYGGGDEIKEFSRENNLLYVTDFINAKKG